ncbi:MAG: hypothetical protein NPIRA04_15770 [Nitrospirales bacterium]|nr:MAG: hypothetical protein NPIRA04_15770 [Nitrospirales bacterium]
MLRSLNAIQGFTLEATDGEIGESKDFFFDDREWMIRYLVADTGKWLPGRLVLLSLESIGKPDWSSHHFPVKLTKDQIVRSPGIEIDKPVSLQEESKLVQYYQWPAYWGGIDPLFPAPVGMGAIPAVGDHDVRDRWDTISEEQANPHLRSIDELIGYVIKATDGEIGHVEDCIADDDTWNIRYFVIDTRNWLPGKKVLVAPDWIKTIQWSDQTVEVDMTQEQTKNCPEYDASMPVNRELEVRVYDYFGRPTYWK